MKITFEDIQQAERIFLKNGQCFDEEAKKFIKCIGRSLHLQACPGSGKTTALLAKLYILSKKMPFENNKGICVLTHTNVAINIIKNKLEERANRILSYPNFFGTIQSFVDKYLAIPAYIKCFGDRLKYIDYDLFYSKLKRYEPKVSKNNWITKNKGKYENNIDFVANINVNFTCLNDIDFDLFIDIKDKASNTYIQIENIFKEIFSDGYIRFEDAYSLGPLYINNFPELQNIFSSRFKYVFIDEAQDTSDIQKKIIEKCFNESVIIQWVGDVNQGIMNDNNDESAWQPIENDRYHKMQLTKSYRISQPIADFIKDIALEKYNTLIGNNTISQKPILIVFDDSTKDKVLDKFAELVIDKKFIYENERKTLWEISELTGNPIKAVGWVGKEKENGLSIKSYFTNFDKRLTSIKRIYFPNLYTMYQLSKNVSPKEFKNRVVSCIIEALYLSDIKSSKGRRFSKTEFLDELKQTNDEQCNKLLSVISKHYISDNFSGFSDEILEILKGRGYKLKKKSEDYLSERKLESTNISIQNNDFNCYKKEINGNNIQILIDTVHGVKGETHTASLYLETKFYKNSIEYLFGQNQNANNQERRNKALKIMHVAFSRPTHLLCVAIHNDNLNNFKNIKDIKLYEVINLTNI